MAKSICSLQMTSKLNLHGNTVLANPDKLILTLTSWTGYKREILYLHQEPVTANITEHNEASPEKNGLVQSIQRLVSISWKQNFSKSRSPDTFISIPFSYAHVKTAILPLWRKSCFFTRNISKIRKVWRSKTECWKKCDVRLCILTDFAFFVRNRFCICKKELPELFVPIYRIFIFQFTPIFITSFKETDKFITNQLIAIVLITLIYIKGNK